MEKENDVSNFLLSIVGLITIIVVGYFVIQDKPRIEKRFQSEVPSEKNNFQYQPSPCLNSEGVIVECKG